MNMKVQTILAGLIVMGLVACQFNLPNPSPTRSASSARPSASPVASSIGSSQPSPSGTNTPSPLPVPPTEGLAAYYPFEGNALSQDRKHDGRLAINMAFDTGIKGKSIKFVTSPIDAVGILFQDAAKIQLGKTFSLSIWSKPFRGNEISLPLICTTGSMIGGFGLFWTSGGADVFLDKGTANNIWLHREGTGRPEVQAYEWHHTVITYDGLQLKIYLDGKLDFTTNYSSSLQEHGKIQDIGICRIKETVNNPTRFDVYEGLLDEFRIYSRVLTDAEVQALYQFDKGDSP